MASRGKSKLWQYWGYGVLAVLLLSLGSASFGPAVYLVLLGLLLVFVLFTAPVYCGAINRRRGTVVEFCRNNSAGLILGCHLRQHKFQKLGREWWSLGWRQKTEGLWTGGQAKLATLSFLVGTAVSVVGLLK